MEQQQRSQKFIRQRKFLMALPLLSLPFITLLFWTMGGGGITNADARGTAKTGFNLDLPDAYLKDENEGGKMSYYDQAQTDALKKRELMKNDPYYRGGASVDTFSDDASGMGDSGYHGAGGFGSSPYTPGTYGDANETKVYDRLKQLDAVLKEPAVATSKEVGADDLARGDSRDLDRLEQLMQSMQQGNEPDPEMQQLNDMMERILDVQHPERVREKLRQSSEQRKGQVFAVESVKQPDPLSSLAGNEYRLKPIQQTASLPNGFYGLDNNEMPAVAQNAIEAVVHETQTVVSGATVKLRLLNDIVINGLLIPKDNFVYGVASLNGERLDIRIDGIRYLTRLFPVAMNVYDIDGLEGINVPGAITRDVAKQSADRSMQNIGFTGIDPSWQMQAAGAGVEAAKSLFSKKVKLIKITLKAGYKVLLYDEQQKQADK